MSNSIGKKVILTLFGESHGPYVGAVLDGLKPGIKVDEECIRKNLSKRRPQKGIETPRVEEDDFQIISGVFNGFTTGSPLTIIIPNKEVKSNDYEKTYGLARPSHADYVAHIKYQGYEDYRGGGHFSGRITAAIVAVGTICLEYLKTLNIQIGTHIKNCYNVSDSDFDSVDMNKLNQSIEKINNKKIPVIDDIEEDIENIIKEIAATYDSIGGTIQTAISNLPVGLGEPWFDSFEGVIAKAAFAIGAVKGIEFGSGFDFSKMCGSKANDSFEINDKKVCTKTNHNGGINGGITNGMPVIFNLAIKPTPSIAQKQDTIDFIKEENSVLEIKGRHDPAIIRRICIVITCLTAIVTTDMLN